MIFCSILRHRYNSYTYTGVANCTADHLSRNNVIIFLTESTGKPTTNTTTYITHQNHHTPSHGLDINSLYRAVQHYYINCLAPSTFRSYKAGQSRYLILCHKIQRSTIPTCESTMLLFVTYLAREGLSYTIIKVYLAAICNLHTIARMHNTYQAQLTPYLEQVLQGIKKHQLPTPHRNPITVDIMANIWTVLSHSPKDHHCITMWAACCLAFLDFFDVESLLYQIRVSLMQEFPICD